MLSKSQTLKTHKTSQSQRRPKAASKAPATRQSSVGSIIQRAEMDPNSLTQSDIIQLQRTIGNQAVVQLLAEPTQSPPVPKSENKTGLPDKLKTGIENLSGLSMDDVRVHYKSPKPAKLRAKAYTQGTDIHVGPGQERHLPHEAWHTVQQKQGRVKPTMQMSGEQINDEVGLEREADVMGGKALQRKGGNSSRSTHPMLAAQAHAGKPVSQRSVEVDDDAGVKNYIDSLGGDQKTLYDAWQSSQTNPWIDRIIQVLAGQGLRKGNATHMKNKLGGMTLASITGYRPLGKGDKAYWKHFKGQADLKIALEAESETQYKENQAIEKRMAAKALVDDKIASRLDTVRTKMAEYIHKNTSHAGILQTMLTRLVPLNFRGSYNYANTYPAMSIWLHKSAHEHLSTQRQMTVSENISVLHDTSEMIYRDVVGHKLLTHGYPSLPQVGQTKDESWQGTREGDDGGLFTGSITKIKKEKTHDKEVQDRGKLNLGTRDESSSDTKLARRYKMPIEAGRSNTTARMLKMGVQAGVSKQGNSAIAWGLFAYWNAGSHGTYPQSMTPVHTFHEVMDVAKNYGVTYSPFKYPSNKALESTRSLLYLQSADMVRSNPEIEENYYTITNGKESGWKKKRKKYKKRKN
ncbi:MAG TPA: DUF4157 domain-containing protein [Thiotrichaceae bacterium]|nr:DUF4157 domain-containing protein [Thiotrichaceae bacterium]